MTDRTLRKNALTDAPDQHLSLVPPHPGRLVLSNELLAELKKQGLNYLHVIDAGEGAVSLAASKNKTIGSNDKPSNDPISEQIKQGFVDLSGFHRDVGVRMGEKGQVYKASDIIRLGNKNPETGVHEQHGLDITTLPIPDAKPKKGFTP